MTYVIIMLLAAGLIYFFARFLLLRAAVADTKKQLEAITEQLKENRILHLQTPDLELEGLLEAMNRSLYEIRRERIMYAKREKEFQQQIENISHDLRTPLTSMIGYLKIMDMERFGTEERENLKIILQKAKALQRLVSQFYDFSRLTAKDYVLDAERIDAARALRETMMEAYTELSAKNLEVSAELPEHPVWILGDLDAVQRIFQNLLQNAGRYAVSALKVSYQKEGDSIVFSFRNDVKNLTKEDAGRLFERFYITDRSRSSGSTGLGLTIAKEFAEKMGGRMGAELEDGGWINISCSFPIQKK